MENENNNKLPMNWWKFCKYFRFPLGIVTLIIEILTLLYYIDVSEAFEVNLIFILPLLIYVGYLVFLIITYMNFIKETRIGYNLLIISLFVELAINSILNSLQDLNNSNFTQSFIIIATSYGIIYVWPSYIYFNKRKYVFNKEEQRKQNEVGEFNDIKSNSTPNLRYCTNCGKNIEDSWTYCNNCGYKLK